MWTQYRALIALFPLLLNNAVSALPNKQTITRQDGNFAGSLTLNNDQAPFAFDYQTTDPFGTNWIGLYHASGGGPVNEEYVAASLVWKYAPETEGSIHLDVGSLEPGDYTAFFLARDGYKWLATPVNATLEAPPADLRFPTKSATLHNARQGDKYSAKIDGLLLGKGSDSITFEKVDGAGWIAVSKDGAITGTPDAASSASVKVRATATSGSTAVLDLTIPVKRQSERLVSDLKVMTFNLWHGGTQVNNYHEKQLRFITESGADVIALQEASSDHATRLGKALGWNYHQSPGSVGIITRYPIAEKYGEISVSTGLRINLNGDRPNEKFEINVWSAHLGYTPYGPYDACFDKMDKATILKREAQSGRTPQITDILAGIDSQLKASKITPVLLAGDFNAPSHLDWVPSLKEKNCGYDSFEWPTSKLPTNKGLIDSFRVAHPDPKVEQATTWSPVFPKHNGATGVDEPQDRIDFIYHTKDRLKVVGSKRLVQGTTSPSPGHKDNEWTSDHAAVLTHYQLL